MIRSKIASADAVRKFALVMPFAAGISAGWTARDWKQGRADADRAEAEVVYRDRIIWRERAQADVSAEVEREAVKEQVHVRTVTETIIKEVPIHVPAEADVRFALPAGLVRVHDAAATSRALDVWAAWRGVVAARGGAAA